MTNSEQSRLGTEAATDITRRRRESKSAFKSSSLPFARPKPSLAGQVRTAHKRGTHEPDDVKYRKRGSSSYCSIDGRAAKDLATSRAGDRSGTCLSAKREDSRQVV